MFPVLDNVIKADDVSVKGTGKYAARYVNWSRIARYLRKHAPGWQPYAAPATDGGIAHRAPDGTSYLLIGFRHYSLDEPDTQLVPHAIMDARMHAKRDPGARDISDAYVRGMCKAAALLFGLGWHLWSKDDPLERDDPHAAPAPPAVEPYDLPDHALAEIGAATSQKVIDRCVARVMASGFVGADLENIKDLTRERRAVLAEEQHKEESAA